jgi:hypothetical protein
MEKDEKESPPEHHVFRLRELLEGGSPKKCRAPEDDGWLNGPPVGKEVL